MLFEAMLIRHAEYKTNIIRNDTLSVVLKLFHNIENYFRIRSQFNKLKNEHLEWRSLEIAFNPSFWRAFLSTQSYLKLYF